jgi:hypothetical protein
VPSIGRWRNRAICSFKHAEYVPFQGLPVLNPSHPCAQLLRDDDAEILERREPPMELLQREIRGWIAKRVDEELRVEDVLPVDHRLAAWRRNLDPLHRSRAVDQLALKDNEIERALDRLGRRRGTKRSFRSGQLGQWQSVGSGNT